MAKTTRKFTNTLDRWTLTVRAIDRWILSLEDAGGDFTFTGDARLVRDAIAAVVDAFVYEEDRSTKVSITLPAWADDYAVIM